MSKHTPGPHQFDEDTGSIEKDGAVLATVCTSDDFPCISEEDCDECDMQAVANGYLFAAAAEMLDALAGILAAYDANDSHGIREEIEKARKIVIAVG